MPLPSTWIRFIATNLQNATAFRLVNMVSVTRLWQCWAENLQWIAIKGKMHGKYTNRLQRNIFSKWNFIMCKFQENYFLRSFVVYNAECTSAICRDGLVLFKIVNQHQLMYFHSAIKLAWRADGYLCFIKYVFFHCNLNASNCYDWITNISVIFLGIVKTYIFSFATISRDHIVCVEYHLIFKIKSFWFILNVKCRKMCNWLGVYFGRLVVSIDKENNLSPCFTAQMKYSKSVAIKVGTITHVVSHCSANPC